MNKAHYRRNKALLGLNKALGNPNKAPGNPGNPNKALNKVIFALNMAYFRSHSLGQVSGGGFLGQQKTSSVLSRFMLEKAKQFACLPFFP